jgi:hypothetical protein
MKTGTHAALALLTALLLPAAAAAQSQAQATPGGGWKPIDLRIGGYFWLDSGFMQKENTQPSFPNRDQAYQQGRFGLLAAYEKSFDDVEVKAEVEFLGLENEFGGARYEAHVLSTYLQLGTKTWDVQIGRFLNPEVFYRGQGIELYTPDEFGADGGPQIYHLNEIRGFQDQPGQVAVHYRPHKNVGIELGGVYGFADTQNVYGVRPMVDVGVAGLRLFAGYELLRKPSNSDQFKEVHFDMNGYAARLQYSLPYVTVGVNYGRRTIEDFDNNGELKTTGSGDTISYGAFADVYLGSQTVLGGGYYETSFENRIQVRETSTQKQGFVSAMYRLPWEGLSVKGVVGYARAEVKDPANAGEYQNDLTSFRVRVAYDFN